jgi:hypothetical protein
MTYTYTNKKSQTYYLHGKQVMLQNGREQRIFYFAKKAKDGEALAALPDGYTVTENDRTGLPFVKKQAS